LKIAGGTGITGDEFLREGDDIVKNSLNEGRFVCYLIISNLHSSKNAEDEEGIEIGGNSQQFHSFEIDNSQVEVSFCLLNKRKKASLKHTKTIAAC